MVHKARGCIVAVTFSNYSTIFFTAAYHLILDKDYTLNKTFRDKKINKELYNDVNNLKNINENKITFHGYQTRMRNIIDSQHHEGFGKILARHFYIV